MPCGPTGSRSGQPVSAVVAGERGALAAEAGVVLVRSGLAVEARADHDEVGLDRGQRVVVEAEAAHRARREVLGDRVGPLDDEPAHELDRLRVLQVEGDVALADVEAVEHRRALEPVRVLRPQRVDAQEVGPALRLDAQHGGAVLDEVARGDRAGGARAELDDVDAVPRRTARRGPRGHRRAARRERPAAVDRRRGRRGGRPARPRRRRCGRRRSCRGNRSMSPTGPKKSRDASCVLAMISRGELAGASMRLVSHARS